MIGRVLLGRYEIESKIGSGGMAAVYKGKDRLLGRAVAVKVLHPQFAADRGFVGRFRREAQAAASLSHPHVVSVFDVGEEDGTHFIVMEHVQGENVKELLNRRGRLTVPEALGVAEQVAQALDAAHRQALIHRDVKPHNILITTDGQVKVADFGIARAGQSLSITQTGTVLGSIHYIPPEQARSEDVVPASDVYALGAVLFEMMSGRPPFDGENAVAVLLKQVEDDPPNLSEFVPDVPAEISSFVGRCLSKRIEDRFADAGAMLQALRALDVKPAPVKTGAPTEAPVQGRRFGGQEPSDEEATLRVDLQAGLHEDLEATREVVAGRKEAAALSSSRPSERKERRRRARAQWELRKRSSGRPRAGSSAREAGSSGNSGRRKSPPSRRRLIAAIGASFLLGLLVWVVKELPTYIFPPEVIVPDVVGLSMDEARRRLQEAGLVLGGGEWIHAETPEGLIARQDHEPGRKVRKNRVINVWRSLGPQMVAVPDLSGMNERVAEIALEDAGLRVESILEETDPAYAPNAVIRQDPPPGELVREGTAVSLVVNREASSSAAVTVPDLIGLDLAEARRRAESLGLVVGAVYGEERWNLAPGQVIDHLPGPNQVVSAGSIIEFVYNERAADESVGAGQTPGTGAESAAGAEAGGSESDEDGWFVWEHSIAVPEGPPTRVVVMVQDSFGVRQVVNEEFPGGTEEIIPIPIRSRPATVSIWVGGRQFGPYEF